MEVIKTLTPMEAAKELNAMGLRCTPETLRFGIEQGTFGAKNDRGFLSRKEGDHFFPTSR